MVEQQNKSETIKKRLSWPERPVSEAVETLWRLVDVGQTTAITPQTLAHCSGLRPRGEHLRSLAMSMRALSLVRATTSGLRISKLGMELADETPGSARYRRLLWESIHSPTLYATLPNRFLRLVPSGEKLVDYLIDHHAMSYADAEQAAVNYRDALTYAGLMTISGERLVPELRVLPRYQPTDTELQTVPPFQDEEETPKPPEDGYRVPPTMPAARAATDNDPLIERHDGHHLEVELSEGRTATLALPSDITTEEVERIMRLLNALTVG